MPQLHNRLNRRQMLRTLGAAAVGGFAAADLLGLDSRALAGDEQAKQEQGEKSLYEKRTAPAQVALVKGNDRRDIVYQALKKIEDQVLASIGDRQILIKPNMVTTWNQLCATHVDAVRAILDFLKPHYKKQVIIGEASAFGQTPDGFKNYGYLDLQKEYDVALIDLNKQTWQYRYVFGQDNRPIPVRIVSTFLDPNVYTISAAQMKTHDRVVTTLSLKNVLLGAPVSDEAGNDKFQMHTGQRAVNTILHFNMFHLAQQIYPDLAVIDGFEAMEGDGPTRGTPFDSRVALASRDALAADTLATKIMGFDPTRIMYLSTLNEAGMGQGDLDKIEPIGTPLDQCQYHFKPNRYMAELYGL